MAESQSRRTYLIDRPFQLRYILALAAWGAALAALFGLWAWQAHQQAAEILARAPGNPALLHQADRQLLWALAGIGALSAGALARAAEALEREARERREALGARPS